MNEIGGDATARPSRRPILVTGMPRSGTTWVARLAATAPGTALTGREPMNARGRQYALAKTLPGWARVEQPSPRQRRALRSAYRGLNPSVYSRYGRRQWAAPFPWTRIVVKDPFAMLSIPAVVATTGARVVVVHRHPGAMLASYRRMGWSPDLDELQPILAAYREKSGDTSVAAARLPRLDEVSEAEAMGRFWMALYAMTLHDLDRLDARRGQAADEPRVLLVPHEELAGGGIEAGRHFFDELGLRWSTAADEEFAKETGGAAGGSVAPARESALHNFDRPPDAVATAWRAKLHDGELEEIESVTMPLRERLAARSAQLRPRP